MKLRTATALALMIGLLLPVLLVYRHALVTERAVLNEELREYHQRTLDSLVLGLQEPVWTMTPALGEPLLNAIMQDRRISLISVRNHEGVFLEKAQGSRNIAGTWSLTQAIVYQEQELGEVLLEIDTGPMEQRLLAKRNQFLLASLLQLLLSLTLLFHLLHRKVFTPVKRLSKAAAALPADRPKALTGTPVDGEIDTLAEAFSGMTERFNICLDEQRTSLLQKDVQLHACLTQLKTLKRLTQAVSSRHDLQAALNSIAHELIDIFDANTVSISMLNAERTSLIFMAHVVTDDEDTAVAGAPLTLEKDPELAEMLEAGKPVTFSAPQKDASSNSASALMQRHRLCALMLVPLRSRGKAVGLLQIGTARQACLFTQLEIDFAETIAEQIVGAIDHARLFNEEHHQRQIAESLQQIGGILNQSLDRDTVLMQIMEQLGRVVAYNGASIFLREEADLQVSGARGTASRHLGARVLLQSSNPAACVFRSKLPLILDDVTTESTWETWEGGEEIRSWIGAPLCIGDKALGVLTVDNGLPGAYGDADAQVLQIFANQAAIAIENAHLYELAQEARTQAEQAARAKSMFLSNISHELRTPLNGILGYTQILGESHELVQFRQVREGLAAIERSGTHLMELINDLLDLAKIESQKLELEHNIFHLSQGLDDIAEIIRLQSQQKALKFFFKKDPDAPAFVYGDEKRISQVLLNLLHNAVKFTEDGKVMFEVTRLDATERQSLSDGREWGGAEVPRAKTILTQLLFEISDSGPGIPEEQMEEIFLPFVQVGDHRQKLKGTGLGLHISQNLLHLMGSELHVESVEGEGSKFWFVLSFREAAQQVPAPDRREQRQIIGINGTPPKILVVDDNTENRKLLLDLLRPIGFKLIEARDGREALRQAFEWKPDLILLDLILPIVDGFELAHRLRASEEMNGVKIIVVSASSSLLGKDPLTEIGCDDFLMKPIRTNELLERLRRHLQLEWVEQDKTGKRAETHDVCGEQELCCCPPLPLLRKVLSFAEGGYVTDLRELIASIQENSPDYAHFSSTVEGLLDNFCFEQIATFTKDCLEHAQADKNRNNNTEGRSAEMVE